MPQNALDQEIGEPVPDWTPRPAPPRTAMIGRYCRVEPLDPARHAADLEAAMGEDRDGRGWTYLPYGPFAAATDYRAWVERVATSEDPLFHAVIDGASGKAAGVASYLRIDRPNGAIEVGHIRFAPRLQRTVAATEAMALMMARVFAELGYRRYEWKCNSLNAASRSAALRLGFRFEGIFRQAMVVKGHNRDTAWYSVLDSEWPALEHAFARWLEPTNFDASGRQRDSLRARLG
ncbi:MAG TPA: GNAT family protein [Stellaceae bacterium]|nr:GNAT family protein [Stellaceae bacterium]